MNSITTPTPNDRPTAASTAATQQKNSSGWTSRNSSAIATTMRAPSR